MIAMVTKPTSTDMDAAELQPARKFQHIHKAQSVSKGQRSDCTEKVDKPSAVNAVNMCNRGISL